MRHYIALLVLLMLVFITACEKPAGEGGTSTIRGKVFIRNYNSNFTLLHSAYYAQEERVYIIYGDHLFYDDNIRTSYDGTYEFSYLRPGQYTVFAYSDDSTFTIPGGQFPVFQHVEITENNQLIEVPTIILLK
ncbi:MAG: hypothetical protein IAE67_08385 [Candidatus Competibacteraceae bacterium]|nr:hypothetical protein [Candidatus Competibacteraceae bacterium]